MPEISIKQSANAAADVEHDPFGDMEQVRLEATPGQFEMWFAEHAGTGASCAYNECFLIRLKGVIDDDALVEALTLLPTFHPALRGHFSVSGEHFFIEPAASFSVVRHDFSNLAREERAISIEQLAALDAQTRYDLEHGPLYRAHLVRMVDDEVVVLLGAHHTVADGWSLDVMLADFARLYTAIAGLGPFPDPPRHSFVDYVRSRNSSSYRQLMESSRAFWRKQFEVLPPALELPHDGTRPSVRSFAANSVERRCLPDLLGTAKHFARSQGISFFAVLLAAYGTLLHRISGASDLVMGVPVAGHPVAGMEDCVGHLVNLVPVRLRFDSESSFLALCQATNTAMLDARENAAVGFGEILAELGVPRDSSRVPLVSTVFTHVQKYAPGKLSFGDCSVDYELRPRAYETFELNLIAIESHDCIVFKAYSNADLLSARWLQRRLGELEQLLRMGCGLPHGSLSALSMLPPDEADWIRSHSYHGASEHPREATVVELLERQIQQSPQSLAVIARETTISYDRLDQRANQLARVLQRRGAKRGSLVGICVNRGVDMVAAVLAVLKTGAAYVPLDPAFPAARLAYMVHDSGLTLVISERELAECHGCSADRTLELDGLDFEIEGESSLPFVPKPDEGARPEDLAYVLYTSGSTGKPKGVCIPHRAVVNFLTSMRREPGLGESDRLLAVTTLSFDIAVLELLLPLTVGAVIVLATREQAADPEALVRLMDDSGATVLQATPVTWRMLVETGWRGRSGLKAFCGGEPMSPILAEALLDRVGQLWNMYGPTETTVYSTICRIHEPSRHIPIGAPIANTMIWVLDASMQPCPVGVPGEIHIGGDGVALGYLNRPALTRERFIVNPFDPSSESRLYKTGDIGRWREDGQLECLGRSDSQVKLRGFRIELGEIESALNSHASIRQAAVVLREDAPGDVKLVAYVITVGGAPEVDALRAHLKKSLPEYMIPAQIVGLQTFPLTNNGKIDRKAFPAPGAVQIGTNSTFEAPRDEVEEQLLGIWRSVLGVGQLSVTSNFFDVGGHSLLAVRIFNGIYSQFHLRLPLATLFECPTVRKMADRIRANRNSERASGEAGWTTIVPIQPEGDLPPLFCVAGLGGNTLNLLPLATAIGPRQPFYGLQHRGVDGVLAPHRTIEAMAEEFVKDIRKVQPAGPYYLAGYSSGGLAAYEMASILRSNGETIGLVILLDTYNPLVSKWAWDKRIRAHWERVKSAGGAYLWWRAVRSTKAKIETLRRMIRARLAEVNRFEYRMDAVIEATHEAERRYVPPKLDVPVSLLQTDFAVPPVEGIGYPLHESNGWRDYVRGKFEISVIRCQHEALVSERMAPVTASIMRKALREERQRAEHCPVSVSSVRFNAHRSPYYEPPTASADQNS